MANSFTSEYKATYTSFAGADITAMLGNKQVGTLQAISYSVAREKAPIYVMGSPDPRSFSRGKRGISGHMVFTVLDRDALAPLKTDPDINTISTAYANIVKRQSPGEGYKILSADDWETAMGTLTGQSAYGAKTAEYADEILPFDIAITFKNEYGNAASFSILGCEIISEGSGMSIDDITTEKACTFVARGLTHLKKLS